jgi:hypothetical protein
LREEEDDGEEGIRRYDERGAKRSASLENRWGFYTAEKNPLFCVSDRRSRPVITTDAQSAYKLCAFRSPQSHC